MSTNKSPLDNLKIASPCPATWEGMYGTDRKRFCGECKLNVYNLSGMTRDEAETLLINSEGRLCVRYYRRPDGTILTKDCPVGWAKVRQRLSAYATAVFAVVLAFLTGVSFAGFFRSGQVVIPPVPWVSDPEPQYTMGAIAVVPRGHGTFGASSVTGEVPAPAEQTDKRKADIMVGRVAASRKSKN